MAKPKNNYVAEKSLSAGKNWGNRKGAGAPLRNFNASSLKHIPELRHLLERCRAFHRRAKIIVAHANAARRDGDHPDKRLDVLLEQLRRCDESQA